MSEHYTDEDVEAAALAISRANYRSERLAVMDAPRWPWAARAVLDAVAPAIAARALRDLAERMESPEWTHRDDWNVNCAYALEVRGCADEIEGR